jgi:four helix bundle protein
LTRQTFRDLNVWQEAADLVLAVYDLTGTLPMSEIGGIVIELRQAAVNVPAKIANGHGRGDPAAFMELLSIACASLAEVTASLELLVQHSYAPQEQFAPLLARAASVDRQLLALHDALAIRIREDPFSL